MTNLKTIIALTVLTSTNVARAQFIDEVIDLAREQRFEEASVALKNTPGRNEAIVAVAHANERLWLEEEMSRLGAKLKTQDQEKKDGWKNGPSERRTSAMWNTFNKATKLLKQTQRTEEKQQNVMENLRELGKIHSAINKIEYHIGPRTTQQTDREQDRTETHKTISEAADAAAEAATRGMIGSEPRRVEPEFADTANVERRKDIGTVSAAQAAARAAVEGLVTGRVSPQRNPESSAAQAAAKAAIEGLLDENRMGRGNPEVTIEDDERNTEKKDERRRGSIPIWAKVIITYGVIATIAILTQVIRRIVRRRRTENGWFRQRSASSRKPVLKRQRRKIEGVEAASIFLEREKNDGMSWLRGPIENRYPLLDAKRAAPKAMLAGAITAPIILGAAWGLKFDLGLGVAATIATITFTWGVWTNLKWQQRTLQAKFAKQFPETVDQIVRLAGAGVPSIEALSVVTEDSSEPVKSVLTEVNRALEAGIDAETALRMTTERIRLAEFTMFAAVLRLQRRSGGGISKAFANLSETLRQRRKTELQAHAATAQTRLTIMVLTIMPIGVLLIQRITAPTSIEALFQTESGTILLRLGIGMIVTGLLVARWIGKRGMS